MARHTSADGLIDTDNVDSNLLKMDWKVPVTLKLVVYAITILPLPSSANGKILKSCVHKQYAEYNERGILLCNFPEDYLAVHWHDINDDRGAEPILTYDGYGKRGKGLESGEYDIFPNGSLIITTVSLTHDKTFTVVCLLPDDLFEQYHIEVVVTVTPQRSAPQISNCKDTDELCIIEYQPDFNLTCSVNGARPASEVSWSAIVGGIEIPINTTVKINTKTNVTFDSSAFLDIVSVPKTQLTHLICKSKLQRAVSWIFRHVIVDMSHRDVTADLTFSPIYSERGRIAELSCGFKDNASMYVWKNTDTNQKISYGVKKLDGTPLIANIPERYEIKPDGILYIEQSKIEDEGNFICVSSDGTTDNVIGTKLVVLVPPSPPYIEIKECTERKCIISFPETAFLTCSVRGVRPSVDIQWKIEQESNIRIRKQTQSTVSYDGLYNVTSIVYLETSLTATCRDTTLTCEATGTPKYLFLPSRVVPLKVNCATEDHGHSTQSMDNHSEGIFVDKGLLILLLVIVGLFFVVVVVVFGIFFVMEKCTKSIDLRRRGFEVANKERLKKLERAQTVPLRPSTHSL